MYRESDKAKAGREGKEMAEASLEKARRMMADSEWIAKNPYANMGEGNIMATLFNDGHTAGVKALIAWLMAHNKSCSAQWLQICEEDLAQLKQEMERG